MVTLLRTSQKKNFINISKKKKKNLIKIPKHSSTSESHDLNFRISIARHQMVNILKFTDR